MNTLTHHRQHPEVTLERHTRSRQIALARSLPVTTVYLDTKFWLIGRDVFRHERQGRDDVQLVERLESLVSSGRIVCPISEAVFVEVMKQDDRTSRRATAELIDRWSGGVTLIEPQRRMATELAHLFYEADASQHVFTLRELVWTKLPFLMGEMHSSDTVFDPATELAVQKAFFDHMWDRPMTEMIDHLACATASDLGVARQDLIDTINDGVATWAHTIRGFASAFAEEARGTADMLQDIGLQILRDLKARKAEHPLPGDHPGDIVEVRAMIAGLLQTPAAQPKLPTAYINAAIHAAVRACKGRKFKVNDLLDFDHAAAALGYCQAFFTDTALGKLLTLEPLQFDARFSCPVAWTSADALTVLTSVAPSPAADEGRPG